MWKRTKRGERQGGGRERRERTKKGEKQGGGREQRERTKKGERQGGGRECWNRIFINEFKSSINHTIMLVVRVFTLRHF